MDPDGGSQSDRAKGGQTEDLLDARARIEEREQESVIATTVWRLPIGSVEDSRDLVGLKVFDDAWPRALEGDGQDPLAKLEVLRVIRCHEVRERMDSGESRVSCSRSVTLGACRISRLDRG
jgi:hypothetical protein